jgi:group I intron endonuclease
MLQNTYNKYGPDSLAFEVLEYHPGDLTLGMEQYWMNLLQPKLNIERVARQPAKGHRWSPETREKRKLRVVADSTREAISRAHKGRKRPPETGRRIADANRGKQKSEVTKQKIREARARQVFTEEQLRKRAAGVRAALSKKIGCSNGQTYESAQAAAYDLKMPACSITHCIKSSRPYYKLNLTFWRIEE